MLIVLFRVTQFESVFREPDTSNTGGRKYLIRCPSSPIGNSLHLLLFFLADISKFLKKHKIDENVSETVLNPGEQQRGKQNWEQTSKQMV